MITVFPKRGKYCSVFEKVARGVFFKGIKRPGRETNSSLSVIQYLMLLFYPKKEKITSKIYYRLLLYNPVYRIIRKAVIIVYVLRSTLDAALAHTDCQGFRFLFKLLIFSFFVVSYFILSHITVLR